MPMPADRRSAARRGPFLGIMAVTAALVGSLSLVLPAGGAETAAVVVELFTSQGCAACRSAEAVAGELARRPSVLVLTLPVPYWDYLGWKDTLALRPFTGRTHQLRVHAAATGTPIVGDGKYGGAEAFLTGGVSRKMHLHARRLVLGLPDGGTLDVKADLPAHFADTLKMLGFSPEDADLPIAPDKPEGPKPKRRRMSSATSGNRRGERRSRGK